MELQLSPCQPANQPIKSSGVTFKNQGCPHCRDVHLAGMSTLQGCSPCRDVHLAGKFTLQGYPPCRHVHLAGMFTLQGCSPCRDIHLAGLSTLQECSPSRDKKVIRCRNVVIVWVCRVSFLTSLFTVPPIPSHAILPCDAAKMFHSKANLPSGDRGL